MKSKKPYIENEERKERVKENMTKKEESYSLNAMMMKEKSLPPLQIPRGMSYKQYASVMACGGD